MNDKNSEEPLSSGVDALIARLREEGVSAGREEAQSLLAEARVEARHIMEKANAEARERLEAARRESDSYRAAGEAALKTAMRDAVLDMKSTLMVRFSADVKRLVSQALQDQAFLKRMILELAGRVRGSAGIGDEDPMVVILPETVVGLEELRGNPEELQKGPVTRFVLGLTGEMLRDGVTFAGSEDLSAGIQVHLKDKEITLDLSDDAVAALLLQHLQPRFRAVLEGIVK